MYRTSHSYFIQNWSCRLHEQPHWKGKWKELKCFPEHYLTLNTLAQLPMWFICLIIAAQLSNIKGFQIILRKVAPDKAFSIKSEKIPLGINDLSLESCSGAIPNKESHTLRLTTQALCSQKQIKTGDTKRTLIAMITAVWGQTTN